MVTEVLIKLYERDLARLRSEIEQYASEDGLWIVSDGITNSAGNLTLHLVGNLKHFIGAVLGSSGYVRDRDAEFSSKPVGRGVLVTQIDATVEVVKTTLTSLKEEDLAATYPIEVFGSPMTTEFFLIHLHSHLNYHLGQINYHRRLLS